MKRLVWLMALGMALQMSALGCSDENNPGGVQDIDASFPDASDVGDVAPDVGPETTPDAVPDVEPEIPPNAVKALSFALAVGDDDVSCEGASHCSIFLSYTGDRTLEVVYTADAEPVLGQVVQFAIEDDPSEIGKIGSLSAYTDAEGKAAVQVSASKQLAGNFVVKAWVDDPDVAPVFFDVTVAPKGDVPLTVVGKYNGQQPLTTYQVRLYLQLGDGTPDCSDLDNLYSDETANQQSPITQMTQTVKFPQFIPPIEAGDPARTYTILAWSTNDNGAVVAWGCNDVDAELVFGSSKTVQVELLDKPPLYAGSYDVTTYMDFVSALPDEVEPYVNAVLEIFQSPTQGLLALTCTLGGSTLEDLCDVVFTDADPDAGLTTIGAAAVTILDALIQSFSQDSIFGDILQGGGDITEMLQGLELKATIIFEDEPVDGMWTAENTSESWHTVVVKWSLGENCDPNTDPTCGVQNFSLNAIQQEAVLGMFTAHVDGFWDLTIDIHPLNLKYGALLNYIVEKLLLKQIIPSEPGEPVIDSYEEFFQALVAGKECLDPQFGMTCCAAFAESLAGETGQAIQGVVEAGCESLVTLGSEFLRDQLTGLDLGTGDAFTIGTAEPCEFYDQDLDHVVDGFGTPANQCKWQIDVDFGFGSTVIDADFYATKSN